MFFFIVLAPVQIFWRSIPYVLCLYTFLKVVSYYDLSVLSMSVMGFPKKSLDGGWVGGVSSIQVFFRIFGGIFSFPKPLRAVLCQVTKFSSHYEFSLNYCLHVM